jgi:ectoine hydroxylase-related dioxygenase (phytanoyl-CoA dioxygenase family)
MLTEAQLQTYLDQGVATVDTPLTPQQIAAAQAAMDRRLAFQPPAPGQKPRYRYSETCSYFDPEILEIIQHPFFEAVAKQVLKTDVVHFYQTAIINAYPQPNTPFSFEQHVDIQYTLSDWQAKPRRIVCSFFLWLTDVNARRAPMMVRPGSHWLLAEARENDPEFRGKNPRVAGVSQERLPALDYAEPVPILAKCGQVSVLTTAAVHGASVNVDAELRRNLVITFTAAGVKVELPPDQAEQKRAYDRELRTRLRPERAHIVAI